MGRRTTLKMRKRSNPRDFERYYPSVAEAIANGKVEGEQQSIHEAMSLEEIHSARSFVRRYWKNIHLELEDILLSTSDSYATTQRRLHQLEARATADAQAYKNKGRKDNLPDSKIDQHLESFKQSMLAVQEKRRELTKDLPPPVSFETHLRARDEKRTLDETEASLKAQANGAPDRGIQSANDRVTALPQAHNDVAISLPVHDIAMGYAARVEAFGKKLVELRQKLDDDLSSGSTDPRVVNHAFEQEVNKLHAQFLATNKSQIEQLEQEIQRLKDFKLDAETKNAREKLEEAKKFLEGQTDSINELKDVAKKQNAAEIAVALAAHIKGIEGDLTRLALKDHRDYTHSAIYHLQITYEAKLQELHTKYADLRQQREQNKITPEQYKTQVTKLQKDFDTDMDQRLAVLKKEKEYMSDPKHQLFPKDDEAKLAELTKPLNEAIQFVEKEKAEVDQVFQTTQKDPPKRENFARNLELYLWHHDAVHPGQRKRPQDLTEEEIDKVSNMDTKALRTHLEEAIGKSPGGLTVYPGITIRQTTKQVAVGPNEFGFGWRKKKEAVSGEYDLIITDYSEAGLQKLSEAIDVIASAKAGTDGKKQLTITRLPQSRWSKLKNLFGSREHLDFVLAVKKAGHMRGVEVSSDVPPFNDPSKKEYWQLKEEYEKWERNYDAQNKADALYKEIAQELEGPTLPADADAEKKALNTKAEQLRAKVKSTINITPEQQNTLLRSIDVYLDARGIGPQRPAADRTDPAYPAQLAEYRHQMLELSKAQYAMMQGVDRDRLARREPDTAASMQEAAVRSQGHITELAQDLVRHVPGGANAVDYPSPGILSAEERAQLKEYSVLRSRLDTITHELDGKVDFFDPESENPTVRPNQRLTSHEEALLESYHRNLLRSRKLESALASKVHLQQRVGPELLDIFDRYDKIEKDILEKRAHRSEIEEALRTAAPSSSSAASGSAAASGSSPPSPEEVAKQEELTRLTQELGDLDRKFHSLIEEAQRKNCPQDVIQSPEARDYFRFREQDRSVRYMQQRVAHDMLVTQQLRGDVTTSPMGRSKIITDARPINPERTAAYADQILAKAERIVAAERNLNILYAQILKSHEVPSLPPSGAGGSAAAPPPPFSSAATSHCFFHTLSELKHLPISSWENTAVANKPMPGGAPGAMPPFKKTVTDLLQQMGTSVRAGNATSAVMALAIPDPSRRGPPVAPVINPGEATSALARRVLRELQNKLSHIIETADIQNDAAFTNLKEHPRRALKALAQGKVPREIEATFNNNADGYTYHPFLMTDENKQLLFSRLKTQDLQKNFHLSINPSNTLLKQTEKLAKFVNHLEKDYQKAKGQIEAMLPEDTRQAARQNAIAALTQTYRSHLHTEMQRYEVQIKGPMIADRLYDAFPRPHVPRAGIVDDNDDAPPRPRSSALARAAAGISKAYHTTMATSTFAPEIATALNNKQEELWNRQRNSGRGAAPGDAASSPLVRR